MNQVSNPSCPWSARSRVVVFLLAASSIACLLADFYRLCPMSFFTPFIFLPALVALAGLAVLDRGRGAGHVWRAVWIGMLAGLIAAVAYDAVRLPFVFAKEWGLDSLVPPMKLFKVFPRFGAMVLVGPDAIRAADPGGNLAAPLLAQSLGGTPFLGFISAVAFATILAVVAGLTL